jgi:PKD repeat protein
MISIMKKSRTKSSIILVALMVLAVLSPTQARACNTNSGMYIDEVNRLGKYNFTAFKNSNGQPYKNNMRITWNFGDGNSGSGQTSHTYSNFGSYTIMLYLWDSSSNCGDTVSRLMCYFHPQFTPVMKSSNDTFYGSVACISNYTYSWLFGDGKTGSSCSVSHKYKKGFYKPVLGIITDTVLGCQDSFIHNFKVFDFTRCGIDPNFTISGTTMNLNERTFTARPLGIYNTKSSRPGKVVWKWGDNTSTTIQNIPNSEFYQHLYQIMGYYTLYHIVTDSAGTCSDTARNTFYIDSCGTDADFTYTVTGNSVAFKANDISGGLRWNFGGGTGSSFTSVQPTAYYSSRGSHTVCLENLSNDCSRKVCKTFSIINCKLLGTYSHSIDTADCLKVHFNQNTSNPNLKFKWDFGDATTSGNKNQTHTYSAKGTYQVKLWAIDTTGNCRDSATFSVTVACPCKLLGNYKYTIDTANCLKVHFSQTTNKPDMKYKWDFGDATTSGNKNQAHTYGAKGTYQVNLLVIDTSGTCRDSVTFSVPVHCVCNIYDSLVLYYDSSYPYQATLYNYSRGTINKHFWDFGDSTTSTSPSPTHSYTKTGRICVTYIAYDTLKNCEDTAILCFTIDTSGNIKRRVFVLKVITPGQTSIEQHLNNSNIRVYPNPFRDGLLISGIAAYGQAEMQIFDALGRQVVFSSRQEGDNYHISFQKDIAAGLYILRLRTDSGIAVYKLYRE